MASVVATNLTWNTTAGNKGVAPTPNVGELIVVIAAASGMASGITVSDNQVGGTYTQIATFAVNNASADCIGVFIRNNLITISAAHSITAAEGTSTGGGLCSIRVAGMQKVGTSANRTVSPPGQFGKQQNQAAGTPAPILPAAALAGNLLIGAVLTLSNITTNTLPPSGWTEQQDAGYNTPATGIEVVTIDSGFTGTTVTWGGATATGFASLVIELDTSAVSMAWPRRERAQPGQLASRDFDPWTSTGWQARDEHGLTVMERELWLPEAA
jgi:hypothetical protein